MTSSVTAMKIEGSAAATAELEETPPADQSEEIQKSWAFGWAVRRKQAKGIEITRELILYVACCAVLGGRFATRKTDRSTSFACTERVDREFE